MKRKNICFFLILFLVICVCAMTFGNLSAQAEGKEKHVLFISSYSLSNDEVQEQIEGITEELGEDTYLEYEFMDTKRFTDAENTRLFYQYLLYKAKSVSYDAVIVGDDNATELILDYGTELFRSTPVFFIGVNDEDRVNRALEKSNMNGIYEVPDYEANFKLMQTMFPERTRVTILIDDTTTGIGFYKNLEPYINEGTYENLDFSVLDASVMTKHEILEKVSSLGRMDILLFMSFFEDYDGNTYSLADGISAITEVTSVPVFRLSASVVGYGSLGGIAYSHTESGHVAGRAINQVLSGVDIKDVEVNQESIYRGMFDYNELKKYNVPIIATPKDSLIINRPEYTLWQDYGAQVSLAGLIVFVIIIGCLLVRIWKLKKELTK